MTDLGGEFAFSIQTAFASSLLNFFNAVMEKIILDQDVYIVYFLGLFVNLFLKFYL